MYASTPYFYNHLLLVWFSCCTNETPSTFGITTNKLFISVTDLIVTFGLERQMFAGIFTVVGQSHRFKESSVFYPDTLFCVYLCMSVGTGFLSWLNHACTGAGCLFPITFHSKFCRNLWPRDGHWRQNLKSDVLTCMGCFEMMFYMQNSLDHPRLGVMRTKECSQLTMQ